MLADEQALRAALQCPVDRQPDPEAIRDPKACCAALMEAAEVALDQREVYRLVASNAGLSILESRCPNGFVPFAERVKCLTGNAGA